MSDSFHNLVPVFAAERECGLEDLVASSGRLSFASVALPNDHPEVKLVKAQLERAKGTNLNQQDLYYLKSVLASTGINRNDDYFDRLETWAARKTPEDKPFNYQHKQDDIIGHITACSVMGADGTILTDDTAELSLPDKFHLLTTAVIYKYCDVPERQERTDRILAELAEGKWYVSMECLFKGFDYVLIPKDSSSGQYDIAKASVCVRNDKTAFLTKHLRAYGGSGMWNGQKIGRVLKNILFHGKGLVEKPANPESLIYSMDNEPLSGCAAKIEQLPEELGYGTDSHAPASGQHSEDSMNEIETLKAQVAELTGKLTAAEKVAAEATSKNWEKQLSDAKAELAAATDKLTKAVEADKANATKLADAEKALTEAKAKITEIETAKAEVEKKLNDITTAAKLADRTAKVKAAFEFETDDEAKAHLETLGLDEVSDEKFDKAIKAQAAYLVNTKVKLGESKTSNLPAPMGGGSKQVGTVGPKATAGALDDTTPTDEVALAVTSQEGDDSFAATQAEIMSFFGKDEETK